MEELCKLLADKLGLAYDYVVANLPDLITRYAQYKSMLNIFGICVALGLIILAIGGFAYLENSHKKVDSILWEHYSRLSFEGGLILFFSIVFTIIGIVTLAVCICDIVAWEKIPEIQMIKECTTLLNG